LPSLVSHLWLPSQEDPSILLSVGLGSSLNNLRADPTENVISIVVAQQYLTVVCLFVVAGTYLPSRCLTMNDYSGFAIPAFRSRVTIYCYVIFNYEY
jgi:hypothetical protein